MLGLLLESPRHGFAVARELTSGSQLGSVWTMPRALVYRALEELQHSGLAIEGKRQAGNRGPNRVIFQVTDAGERRFREWLSEPVPHLRELRTELMLKLAFHARLGLDPGLLLTRQMEVLVPLAAALGRRARRATGFEATLAWWRYQSALTARRFTKGLLDKATRP